MKKIIFVVIAVLLLSFAAVSAQKTTTEEKTLTFSTIGDMISWTTTPEEIYNLLSEYNVEVSVEQDEKYGKTISASGESEDEKFMYVFYFDNDTEALWEVECAAMLYDGTLIVVSHDRDFLDGLRKQNPMKTNHFPPMLKAMTNPISSPETAQSPFLPVKLKQKKHTDRLLWC